jgi:hypothetical protein
MPIWIGNTGTYLYLPVPTGTSEEAKAEPCSVKGFNGSVGDVVAQKGM